MIRFIMQNENVEKGRRRKIGEKKQEKLEERKLLKKKEEKNK